MFCPNCGTNIPEGSGFCPKCGKQVGQPQPRQPFYQPEIQQGAQQPFQTGSTQPQQPTYVQPQTYAQPVYTPGVYAQPQKKKMGAGKIVLIVLLCLLIPVILLVGAVSCVACIAAIYDDGEIGSTGSGYSEDFDIDEFLEQYGGNYDDNKGEKTYSDFDTSEIEGEWVNYSLEGEFKFSIDDEGNIESDDLSEYFFDKTGAEFAFESTEKVGSDSTRAHVTAELEGDEYEFDMFYNENIIDILIEDNGDWATFCRNIKGTSEAKNKELEEAIVGVWEEVWEDDDELPTTREFHKAYVGVVSYSTGETVNFEWQMVGNYLIVNYGEYINIYYVEYEDGELYLWMFYDKDDDNSVEAKDIDWGYYEYKRMS